MDIIRSIKIENVKGKASFNLSFSDLTANQPNIIVAPNGYGKSTLATAFKAAANGKMKLDTKDFYQQNPSNHPKLEIELIGNHAGTFVANDSESNISNNMTLFTICCPLYAKNTTRGNYAATADLRVEQITVYNRIPSKYEIDYKYRKVKSDFGDKGKLFVNISKMLMNYDNIHSLLRIKENLKKCCSQRGIQQILSKFLDNCILCDDAITIKNQITQTMIDECYSNNNLKSLIDCISSMNDKPSEWCQVDSIFTAIQICHVNPDLSVLKKVEDYLRYKKVRYLIDNRLQLFNTTGREIKTHEDHGKLIINFERASAMSNGERDVLSFISKLSMFELVFKKDIGILIIDEVFDYLDGSNLLAVQYYLSELIDSIKSSGKILFPIILTHLDPAIFANYYFKKKKIHYISSFSTIDINSSMVKLLRLRENNQTDLQDEIEKYYIHYIDEIHQPSPELVNETGYNYSNIDFQDSLYNEIKNKYLNDIEYDSLKVIAGIRIRIEELVYSQLSNEYRNDFIKKHKTKNKLEYAEDNGVTIPELYYLLQPLYNDGLHLRGNDEEVKRKIKSCYLKTDNLHIRRMIGMLFE